MNTIGIILLVAFVIVCILLVLLVLVQDDGQNGMGGLLGGRGMNAFGSHSASVLTKSTAVFVVLFFVIAFALALVNRKPKLPETLNDTTPIESDSASEPSTEEQKGDNWWASTGESTNATIETNAATSEGAATDEGAGDAAATTSDATNKEETATSATEDTTNKEETADQNTANE